MGPVARGTALQHSQSARLIFSTGMISCTEVTDLQMLRNEERRLAGRPLQ